jgi:hypothetical protein
LLDELVQAHLDSIELLLEVERHLDDLGHVDYLRSLVRAAKEHAASLDPPADRQRPRL